MTNQYTASFFSFILLVAFTLLQGCETYSKQKDFNKFDVASKAYKTALRWGDWDTIATLTRSQDENAQPRKSLLKFYEPDYYEKIKVTDVQQSSPELENESNKEISYFLFVSFYEDGSNQIQKKRLDMHWWYDEEKKSWFTDTAFLGFLQEGRNLPVKKLSP